MRAIVMRQFGGPEVLQLEDCPEPQPRTGHAIVDVTRAGVNYADLHARHDSYLAPIELPFVPGNEIVGSVDGRRVVALTKGGGYAERALVHKRVMWEVPDDITDDQAAVLALQGNSAWHILFTVAQVRAGETVVIPAAAGGVGTLAVQLAHQCGARVIALASTEERRKLALSLGATAAVDSSSPEGLAERIKDAAGGPVQVALEMTGGQTFHEIVDTLAPRGRLVNYGFASGQSVQIDIRTLLERSITAATFWLPHLFSDRTALPTSMKALFAAVRTDSLRLITGGSYALADAAQAHRDLASRTTTGKLVIDTTR